MEDIDPRMAADKEKRHRWLGPEPTGCQMCGCSFEKGDKFIDGNMKGGGPWAILCVDCHRHYGVGLGTGRGQEYTKS